MLAPGNPEATEARLGRFSRLRGLELVETFVRSRVVLGFKRDSGEWEDLRTLPPLVTESRREGSWAMVQLGDTMLAFMGEDRARDCWLKSLGDCMARVLRRVLSIPKGFIIWELMWA